MGGPQGVETWCGLGVIWFFLGIVVVSQWWQVRDMERIRNPPPDRLILTREGFVWWPSGDRRVEAAWADVASIGVRFGRIAINFGPEYEPEKARRLMSRVLSGSLEQLPGVGRSTPPDVVPGHDVLLDMQFPDVGPDDVARLMLAWRSRALDLELDRPAPLPDDRADEPERVPSQEGSPAAAPGRSIPRLPVAVLSAGLTALSLWTCVSRLPALPTPVLTPTPLPAKPPGLSPAWAIATARAGGPPAWVVHANWLATATAMSTAQPGPPSPVSTVRIGPLDWSSPGLADT